MPEYLGYREHSLPRTTPRHPEQPLINNSNTSPHNNSYSKASRTTSHQQLEYKSAQQSPRTQVLVFQSIPDNLSSKSTQQLVFQGVHTITRIPSPHNNLSSTTRIKVHTTKSTPNYFDRLSQIYCNAAFINSTVLSCL